MAVTPQLTALQVMQDAPVIPVIVLNDVAHAVPMARALVAGGIRMLEVTLRTPQALACMEAIAKEVPDAVVGAGTVRSAADAKAAANAGAKFAVSPGYTSAVGQACRDQGLALLPGVAVMPQDAVPNTAFYVSAAATKDSPLAQALFKARSYYGFVDPPRSVALELRLRF